MHTDESVDKQIVGYTHNRILVIKRNEVLMHATTWRNLGNNMLSEKSQAQNINIV